MKKIYLCIIFILPIFTFAQSPCDQTQVVLSSQAEVDNFPTQFCSTLCSLTIQGDDITNLDSLYVLEKAGSIRITFNPVLADINGLSNVTTIEGCNSTGLYVEGNNLLSNLDGFSGLTRVDGFLSISSNTMLSDITGLSNVTGIDAILIESNASLQNINGLEGITQAQGDLTLRSNPGLMDVSGLSNLTHVTGAVGIGYNDALPNLDGLSSLARIGGHLMLQFNSDLANIAGLSNLDHIGQFSPSGMSLSILYNEDLASLNGLQKLDTIPGTLTVEGNNSLTDLNGLSSLRTLDLPVGDSYNTGIRIAYNESLADISGLSGVAIINHGRSAYLEIESNAALTTIAPLALTTINGNLVSRLMVRGNTSLADIDGLSSLTAVYGGVSALVEVSGNPALQNIDGLSNLSRLSSSRGGTLTITNNISLGRFCGLYTLFNSRGIGCGSPQCYSTEGVTIEGNERNPTPEEIEEQGPCDATFTQPTNLVFSQVTSEGMRLRFNRGDGFISGYLVLMKSYGPPAPEDQPEDGETYHVGQVIGSSSIVVHVNSDTTFVVSGLVPSTPYYFDIFSYRTTENGNDYLLIDPLEGSQATTAQAAFVSSLTFTDVTDESMTVMLNEPEPGNYIALMKAFGYPSPNDTPEDGTEYHVGNTVGSSTIVVNIGDGSAFTVNGLVPGVTYYFDIYRYDPSTFVYDDAPSQGSQRTNNEGENLRAYPNPFNVTTTIPFEVSGQEQPVQVAIYDAMGMEVNVLTTGSFGEGRHEATWDGYDKNGRRVHPGVYIYSVKSGGEVVTGRVSLR